MHCKPDRWFEINDGIVFVFENHISYTELQDT